jgi:UDP-glucose 4-epimerase
MVPKPREALQFVHEDDLVEAVYQLLAKGKTGVFNISGQGIITFDEMVKMLGGTLLPLPFKLLWALNAIAWKLRLNFLTEFPSPTLNIFRYPWVASSAKLENELGFQFRFDTRSAFEHFARHMNT